MSGNSFRRLADEQLVEMLRHGQSEAMSELYKRYFPLIYRKSLSFTKDSEEARDMAQDILLKILHKIDTFRATARFSTWVYSVTFHHGVDWKRRQRNATFTALNDWQYEEDDDEKNDLWGAFDQAFAEMAPEDQNLLVLKYLEKKSIQELEVIYRISASAVKMRLKRARERLALKVA